jgi:DNA-binding NtrC family response regulator
MRNVDNIENPARKALHEGVEVFVEAVSPNMRAVELMTCELAQQEVPVLLLAEPGAGKMATARRMHALSPRANQHFHALSCRSVEGDLISTLAGLPAGTVFLQEIGDLNASAQGELLQVLAFVKERAVSAGVRLICGSSRDLEGEVRARRFREDLYYRVSAVCLRLPPLRQRREDIPHLMSFFLLQYGQKFNRPVPPLSEGTQRLFKEYAWPGNIHELEEAAKVIVALGNEDLAMGGLRARLSNSGEEGNGERVSLKQVARAASREAEKELILRTLNRTRWNRRRAAQELQISYKALLYKLKQIGYGECEAS